MAEDDFYSHLYEKYIDEFMGIRYEELADKLEKAHIENTWSP